MKNKAVEECIAVLVKHYHTERERRRQPFAEIADQHDAEICAGILESINVLEDMLKGEKP